MKRHIAEELPERQHHQADASQKPENKGGGKKEGATPEKRIRQAVYDIRYRARREKLTLSQAYSQFMSNSNMSQVEKTEVKRKLAGKDGKMNENYNIEEFACDNIANAFYRVFVENDSIESNNDYIEEVAKVNNTGERKYKVRVTDKNGTSYVRYATREKINQLRSNPNIDSVEMTEYGEPYEGEKKRGEQTAAAKRGSKLDPVGKEDGDIDNDGDRDKSDKYLLNRRKVRGTEISKRGTQKEEVEFLDEVRRKKKKEKKYDVMRGQNKVCVNPPENKNMGEEVELEEKKLTAAEKIKKEQIAKKLKPKYGKSSKTYAIATSVAKRVAEEVNNETEEKVEKTEMECDDPRSIPTKISLMKNKMRSMGLMCSYESDGDLVDEERRGEFRSLGKPDQPGVEGRNFGGYKQKNPADFSEFQKPWTPPAGVKQAKNSTKTNKTQYA